MSLQVLLESIISLCSITYTVLLIREDIRSWIFGIVASLLSVYLFMNTQLYGQAVVYSYYVVLGMYGWYTWNKKGTGRIIIHRWLMRQHLIAIGLSVFFSLVVGYLLKTYTQAAQPYADSFIAVFAFLATYMQTRKILSSWLYWFVINSASILLYVIQGLYLYAVLMGVYAVLCIPGYLQWRKHLTDSSL